MSVETPIDENYKLHRRFDRIGRLVGDQGMSTLFQSRVAVIGLGGVGSFAAEALHGTLASAALPFAIGVGYLVIYFLTGKGDE